MGARGDKAMSPREMTELTHLQQGSPAGTTKRRYVDVARNARSVGLRQTSFSFRDCHARRHGSALLRHGLMHESLKLLQPLVQGVGAAGRRDKNFGPATCAKPYTSQLQQSTCFSM